MAVADGAERSQSGAWRAQAGPQLDAIRKPWVDELLYGGAVGGGKSDFLLGDFAQDVPTAAGPFWHGILFRKTYPQLEELISRSKEIYPTWFDPNNRGLVTWLAGDKMWRWKNGSTLKLRFLENDDDWMEYHGHQYGWMGYDELTTWASPNNYMKLKARLRSASEHVKYRRIRCSSNPGGPGHLWVREYFGIDRHPKGGVLLTADDKSRMTRMFIASRLQDNKILMQNDPSYIDRLQSLGSPALVKAWLEGDWSVIQGQYFSEFSTTKHVIAPFEIPATWTRFRCMDWGSAAPFAVYWIAISDGQMTLDGRVYPKGAMIVYREWYGAEIQNGKWVGVKMTAEEVGEGIAKRDGEEEINDSVIDPAAWQQNGGPSIVERMARATNGKIMFRRGDNKRIPGWDMVRERLRGGPEGPMLYFFFTCPEIIRTLPGLQHDPMKAEDVDTDGEDHGPDALRYGCMSRPWVSEVPKPPEPKALGYKLDDLWNDHDRSLSRRARS